ncbi:MAG: 3-hydroxyacyl-CoA dehydrogenase family protein [Actinobacteria bacterium]|jgi:3-hydroxybutyryl-CoA dehydrogenase|nr:3-hydroxyacyl-CoA dehydrogenase family protein [Actinomycetota bacterium]MCL6094819.1 3-hydroxyacyl-CoA dehydrogenase family protein [Actinomycetota bacterium]
MGRGIAYAFLVKGVRLQLADVDLPSAQRSAELIHELLNEAVNKGKLDSEVAEEAWRILEVKDSPASFDAGADLLIEAVPEQEEMKKSVLSTMEERDPLLLASNTSAIRITALASALKRPEQFLGMHFFNPVWAMPLVEVVVSPETSYAARQRAVDLVGLLGKEAIVVRDSPGFATSRLGIALGLEAIRMVEENVAEPADIDRAMELGYRHPMGPLRLGDLVGLDVRLDIARTLAKELGPRFEPPQLLIDMVAKGKLGKKTGEGFYRW